MWNQQTGNHQTYWRLHINQSYLWRYNLALGLPKHVRNCLDGDSLYPSNGATFRSPRAWFKLPARVFHERWVSAWFILLHSQYPDDRLLMIDIWFVKNIQLTFSRIMTYIYIYIGRTAPLTSRRCILYIYSTNIRTEYFKHAHTLRFSSSKFHLFHNAIFFCFLYYSHFIYRVC
jgi:hypothetical protein